MALLAVSAAAQSPYFTAITNLNPVGYWPMHELEAAAPGDFETNYGSLGLLGTGFYADWASGANTGAIQHQVAGPLNNPADFATFFDGTGLQTGGYSNAMFVPHTSPLSTLNPPFSVECWFYSTLSQHGYIWSQEGYEGLNAGPSIGAGGVGGGGKVCGMQMFFGPAQNSIQYYDNSSAVNAFNINDVNNAWQHFVVTCDAGTNVSYFVDGVQSGASHALSGLYSPDYWTPFELGNGRGNGRGIQGYIAEVAIYTNVIPDIGTHYSDSQTGTNGAYVADVMADNPVVYLRMDGPTYTPPSMATWPVLTNFGSVAINGAYTPGTMPGIVQGPNNAGGSFDGLAVDANVPQLSGVSSFADAGYATAYNPTGPVPFSVVAMFRGNPADNRTETIVGHSTNSWAINLTTLGKLECQIGTNTASTVISAGTYNDGNWHQAVEVYAPGSAPTANGTNSLYVDGVLDTSVSTVSTNGFGPGTNLDVMIGTDPQYTNTPVGVGRQFSGQVCEVAIFGRALTVAQVQALYNVSGVPPFITQQPVSGTVNLNEAFTNTVVAAGGVLGYQWYENGVVLSNQTTSSLILNPVVAGDNSADYYVVVSNSYISVTSAVVSLTVNSGATILGQTPTTLEVFAGTSPTLFMNAAGTGTLQFQWTSNGSVISGASSSSYTVPSLTSGATYGGSAYNAYGTNPISPVTVTVLPDPSAPYPLAVLASHPMDYWRLDESSGSPVGYDYTGGNNGTYTNANLGNSGYSSQFTPQSDPGETSVDFGNSTTNNSYLGMVPTFVNFGAPSNTSAEFSVEAWIHPNGAAPDGAGLVSLGYGNGGEQFCLDLVTANNDLSFFVRDAGGTAFTAKTTFTPADGIWHHVTGVCDEANGFIYLYADGQLIASNVVPVGGGILASTNSLVIGSRQEGLDTQFDDQISGGMDDVALYDYALSASEVQAHYLAAGIAPNNVQIVPANQDANVGSTVTFAAGVTATAPLSYFWTDGNDTLVSTNPVLTLTDVQSGIYNYTLQVTNLYGQASSASATLSVHSGPVTLYTDISPVLTLVEPGAPVTFTVGMYGTPPITYQWYLNSTNAISGATNSSYTFLASVGTNTYNVVATNEAGTASSSSSTATVIGSTTIGFGESGSGWSSFGGSSFTGSPAELEITGGTQNEARTAFFITPQNIEGFLASFTYTPTPGDSANLGNGATFVLQNSSGGVLIRGGLGQELGYYGITPSVALEFDLEKNSSPGGAGINWETNGLTAQIEGLPNGKTGSINIGSGDPIGVTVYYDYPAGQLDVAMVDETNSATFHTNYTVGDLGALLGSDTAYVGFTGGTAADDSIQTISDFTYSSTSIPVVSVGRAAAGSVVISWPETITSSFLLQQSDSLTGPWSDVITPPTPNPVSPEYQVQVTVSPAVSAQFYRLNLPNP
ncbi:MAG TPA: LamG-like jellyroll fold domain-containing protein [Verrucomicrobiae bacterium]|nr:LamG-like jellyroll fold domain-containing protein [Verrucomicrobiae bacterium]